MEKRPLSLSIIGWFLVVSGVLGVLGLLTMTRNPAVQHIYEQSPLPIWAHIAFSLVGIIVVTACGYGVLKGLNWSRLLYVGWSLIGFAMSFATIRVTSILLLGMVLFAVIVFFLFRPSANVWFNRTAAKEI